MTGSSLFFYIGIAVGLFYLFYLRMSTISWDERERAELALEELHLGHLMQLIDAPDVRQIAEDPGGRHSLFRGFSQFLLEDIQVLGQRHEMGFWSGIWLCLFYLGYSIIKLKSWLSWGRNDLLFLVGLELSLIRSIRRE